MPSNLDSVLGVHEYALNLQARRSELLASNLANADTPNYKARDIDFKAMIAEYAGAGEGPRTTNARHIGTSGANGGGEALYRAPTQASIDGNTVDPQVEKAEYMQNSLRYQATLDFVNGSLRKLTSALKGQ